MELAQEPIENKNGNFTQQAREPDEMDVVAAMRKYGGSFVKALAEAYVAADGVNREKVRDAWPDYWLTYSNYARRDGEVS